MRAEDEVRVDFMAMRAAGAHLGQAAGDARDAFDRGHGQLEATMVGWTGASKAALSALTSQWRITADSLVTAVDDHVAGIREAADRFEREELAFSADFRRIGGGSTAGSPSVNLD
ncbi:MAG: WXG100 family type VII secretion target [Actinomycetota bacterium]|nr:WXG100 family type VII secretion target [Actinomycetota bacterium]